MTLAQENNILALIGTEPDGLKPIEIQKLMFMYAKLEETIPSYDFIPYEQGCYSPTLAQDVHKLAEKGFLKALDQDVKDKKKWTLTESGRIRIFVWATGGWKDRGKETGRGLREGLRSRLLQE